jgi:hypothetical protein
MQVEGSESNDKTETNFACKLGRSARIPSSWILLDKQLTVDVFSNADLLKNIRQSNTCMIIHCNARSATTNQVGDVEKYGTVWYHPNGIANIISLAIMVERGFEVQYDSTIGNGSFYVTKHGVKLFEFKQSNGGLLYCDTSENTMIGTTQIDTVADNLVIMITLVQSWLVVYKKASAVLVTESF